MKDPRNSLEVSSGGEVIFTSRNKWLHPLFELETFLAEQGMDGRDLTLEDKIVGMGAAFLIVRLRPARMHTAILSRPGRKVLLDHGLAHSWDNLVDRIDCRTEDILKDETDPESAHTLLLERARAAEGR